MNFQSPPIVDGCYLDLNSEMFKVRMISYFGENITEVIIEDTYGDIKSVDINKWHNLRPIPCCYSGSETLPAPPISA